MNDYVSVTVDIDIDEIKEDVLREVCDDDLVEELERRGMENNVDNGEYFTLRKLYFNSDDLKRHLCDICDCGYHEPIDSLLNKIKDLL